MTQLKLDPVTHDLAVEAGGFANVSGEEEIRQHLRLRLHIFKGEVVYATDVGVPYIQEVMRRGTPPERLSAIFREAILGTPGITQITEGPELELDPATRLLTLTFSAETDAGLLDFSEPITTTPLPEVT